MAHSVQQSQVDPILVATARLRVLTADQPKGLIFTRLYPRPSLAPVIPIAQSEVSICVHFLEYLPLSRFTTIQ